MNFYIQEKTMDPINFFEWSLLLEIVPFVFCAAWGNYSNMQGNLSSAAFFTWTFDQISEFKVEFVFERLLFSHDCIYFELYFLSISTGILIHNHNQNGAWCIRLTPMLHKIWTITYQVSIHNVKPFLKSIVIFRNMFENTSNNFCIDDSVAYDIIQIL